MISIRSILLLVSFTIPAIVPPTQKGQGTLHTKQATVVRALFSGNKTLVAKVQGYGDGDIDCQFDNDRGTLFGRDFTTDNNCILYANPTNDKIFLRLINNGSKRIQFSYEITEQ